MDGLHFIYFSDPMCSWCWGFAPVIEQIAADYGEALPVRLVMGGLRPGTEQAMTSEAMQAMRSYWSEVHEASGQPFDEAFFERRDFVYDTDPAARAVVLVRREAPGRELAFLGRAQRAFYAENRDVTAPGVLAELAAEFGVERQGFEDRLAADDLKQETWRDYAISQRAGVTGFPTLIAGPGEGGVFGVVTRGFQPADQVQGTINRWIAGLRAA